MPRQARTELPLVHETSTSFINSVPTHIDAGADISLQARVICPNHCDLRGDAVNIVDETGAVVRTVELAQFDGTGSETNAFVIRAPMKPREYQWTAAYVGQSERNVNPQTRGARAVQAISHRASSTLLSFTVKPHATSMAVWDVPSPIAYGALFKVKVGAQCAAGCKLSGSTVQVRDQGGTIVGSGTLGETPWSEGGSLYWAEIDLRAPTAEGAASWQAKLTKTNLELAHAESDFVFGFATAKPAEHTVTVQVVDRDTKVPLENAHVMMDPYKALTDDKGVARLMVSKGDLPLDISKGFYKDHHASVTVSSDLTITVELFPAPIPEYY